MKKFIDTYRGAEIFEDQSVSQREGKEIVKRLYSAAIVPGSPNLHTDFMEDSDTIETALEKIHTSIDQYLRKHELEHFGTDDG